MLMCVVGSASIPNVVSAIDAATFIVVVVVAVAVRFTYSTCALSFFPFVLKNAILRTYVTHIQ